MKKLVFFIFLMTLLTGCGTAPQYFEPETITTENSGTETQNETESTVAFQIDPELEKEGFSFSLESTDGYLERLNGYTNELKYSFQIDTISLTGTMSSIYDGELYGLKISFSGHKLYDILGDEARRGIRMLVRIKDSSGTVVGSEYNWDCPIVQTGESFQDLEISFSTMNIPTGNYVIDINTPPDDYSDPVTENTEYFNPERYYTSSIPYFPPDEDEEAIFHIEDKWIWELAMHEIYIDENLMLHGIFSEPYDLHRAEYSVKKNEINSDKIYADNDFQYSDEEYYYTITDFDDFSDIIPEECIPSFLRVLVSPHGNLSEGERESIYVYFGYKHHSEDEHAYTSCGFSIHPANALTQKEWSNILSAAEKYGISLSVLSERAT